MQLAPVDPIPAALASLASTVRCRSGDLMWIAPGDENVWCRLVSGAAVSYVLMSDGRRQVIDLLLPGDHFGLKAAHPQLRTEAIASPTQFLRLPYAKCEELIASDAAVARCLVQSMLRTLTRIQAQAVMLRHASATGKVTAFLLELASRCPPRLDGSIVLPMSRYDIADYLGMAVETVSRVFTQLRSRQVISMKQPRVLFITQRSRLEELCQAPSHAPCPPTERPARARRLRIEAFHARPEAEPAVEKRVEPMPEGDAPLQH